MRASKLKNRKCKDCGATYTPLAPAKPLCKECGFKEQQRKHCKYQQKALVNRSQKPQKPLKAKQDVEQDKIHAEVRKRDVGKPCVSCGVVGRVLQAGHFYARSECSELRQDYSNIHGQCGKCNSAMSTNPKIKQDYRIEIEKRIGSEELARLDKVRSEAGMLVVGKVKVLKKF
jgi:5-methylcytosine-specific restriction endonuclease McrA